MSDFIKNCGAGLLFVVVAITIIVWGPLYVLYTTGKELREDVARDR